MKKKRFQKRISFIAAAITAVLISAGVSAEPLITDSPVGAKAAIVIEAATGRVIFEQDANKRLPMASTTKIISTMIALEHGNLDQPFTVDADAIRVEGSSMGLKAGDTVTLRTLCYGMMLPSGNDAANAAAVRVAGSVDKFVELMNERAQKLGLKNTNFVTPSGLDAKDHYSTAYDMAMLTREAMKNPDFEAITSCKSIRLSYGNPPYDRWLSNHNRLITSCEGVIGGKTGFTEKSGRCLVSVARREGITLICVTLGAPDDWNLHRKLYDQLFGVLKPLDLSQYYANVQVDVVGGTQPKLKLNCIEDQTLVLTEDEASLLSAKVRVPSFVYAPVEAGEHIGEVEYYMDGIKLWSDDLVAAETIALSHPERVKTDFAKKIKNFFTSLFGAKKDTQ